MKIDTGLYDTELEPWAQTGEDSGGKQEMSNLQGDLSKQECICSQDAAKTKAQQHL